MQERGWKVKEITHPENIFSSKFFLMSDSSMAILRDQTTVVGIDLGSQLFLWILKTSPKSRYWPLKQVHKRFISTLQVFEKKRRLATLSYDRKLVIYSLNSNKLAASYADMNVNSICSSAQLKDYLVLGGRKSRGVQFVNVNNFRILQTTHVIQDYHYYIHCIHLEPVEENEDMFKMVTTNQFSNQLKTKVFKITKPTIDY